MISGKFFRCRCGCNLPGNLNVRMTDNIGRYASLVLRLPSSCFSKYQFMNLMKTYLSHKNAQRPHQYRSKNRNVIGHWHCTAAPLCYLPHLCQDPSNDKNPCFKQKEICLTTCLKFFFEIFVFLERPKSTSIAL